MCFVFRDNAGSTHQVQSQVDVPAPNDGHMLVLQELDVAGAHEPVDHESDRPVQVGVDLAVLRQYGFAAAVFLGELVGHRLTDLLPRQSHQVPVFGNGKTAPRLVRDLDDRKLGHIFDDAAAVCVCKDLAYGHHVLMHGQNTEKKATATGQVEELVCAAGGAADRRM